MSDLSIQSVIRRLARAIENPLAMLAALAPVSEIEDAANYIGAMNPETGLNPVESMKLEAQARIEWAKEIMKAANDDVAD